MYLVAMKRIMDSGRAKRLEHYPDDSLDGNYEDPKIQRFYNQMLDKIEEKGESTDAIELSTDDTVPPPLEIVDQKESNISMDLDRPPVRSTVIMKTDGKVMKDERETLNVPEEETTFLATKLAQLHVDPQESKKTMRAQKIMEMNNMSESWISTEVPNRSKVRIQEFEEDMLDDHPVLPRAKIVEIIDDCPSADEPIRPRAKIVEITDDCPSADEPIRPRARIVEIIDDCPSPDEPIRPRAKIVEITDDTQSRSNTQKSLDSTVFRRTSEQLEELLLPTETKTRWNESTREAWEDVE
jgi:hypothetical protein